MNLAFRIVVLVLAIFGGAGQLFLGLKWRGDAVENTHNRRLLAAYRKTEKELDAKGQKPPDTEVNQKIRKWGRVLDTVPYLLAGALMSLVGGVIAMVGYPYFGVVWLFLAQIGPAILQPPSMIFSCFLPLAIVVCGVTCFIPKPDPSARRPRRDRDDYDDRDYRDEQDDDRRRGRDDDRRRDRDD